jgi:Na+-driven multidrug efflux pump
MTLLRRFLVVQALLVWQGGFFFYAAVVVPIGADVYGSFGQGMVTRHVTDWMNVIGAGTIAILAWDQWANRESRRSRAARWGLWAVMAGGLPALALIHPRIETYIDSTMDYATFYLWHRVYLYVVTAQWVASLAYVAAMLRAWGAKPQAD